MTTNPYFQTYLSNNEQNLYEDLTIECIKQYGFDVFYLPRKVNGFDELYTEDNISSYVLAKPIEMYLQTVDSFDGQGTMFGKFGLEVRDQMTFAVAKKRFVEEIGTPNVQTRPYEGDLLFIPLLNAFFKITYSKSEDVFYQNGKLRTYSLKCELFDYSGEHFLTGNSTIDTFFDNKTQEVATSEELNTNVPFSTDDFFETEFDKVKDVHSIDPFSDL